RADLARPGTMTDVAVDTDPAGSVKTVDDDVQRLGSRPIVLALLTYNNAATVPGIAQTGYRGLSRAFPDVPLAIVNADSGSSDGTTERLVALGLPVTLGRHESPLHELTAVPLAGALAMSGRLVEHLLLLHPGWRWAGRDLADLWIIGTAIADGFAVWEAWLGPRRVESRTRTTDLPTMVAQTLGGVFALMERHADL